MSPVHERPFKAPAWRAGSDRVAADPPSRRRVARLMVGAASAGLLPPMIARARAGQPVRTLRPGILCIGAYFVNPPFEFISRGKRMGFEVDLMEAIARRLDLRVEFVNTRWETMLREMRENRYDCIVGGITITPGRQRLLAWSVPYMTTTLSLVVDLGRSPGAGTPADLKNATVGVQAATTDYDVRSPWRGLARLAGSGFIHSRGSPMRSPTSPRGVSAP